MPRRQSVFDAPIHWNSPAVLQPGDNLSIAEPSDDAGALDDLDIVSADRTFDRPNNIRIVFTDEDESGSNSAFPRPKLINSIGGHDEGLSQCLQWYCTARVLSVQKFDFSRNSSSHPAIVA